VITQREWTQHILLKSLCSPSREKVNRLIIADIRPEYFSSNMYRKSLRLVKEHFEEDGVFYTWSEFLKSPKLGDSNSRKIKALEQRRKTLVKEDDSYQLPSTKEEYITFFKRVQHDAKHLKLVDLQNELSDKLEVEMDEESLAPLLELVRDTISEIDQLKMNKGALFEVSKKTVKDKLKEFYKNLKNRFFVPTGFRDFDNINIGIPLDSLFVMAAPTGCGKSSMCLQYLINATKAGARCCLLPLEMSEEQMIIRLASNLLEIPANELVKDLKRYYKKIIRAVTDFVENSEGVLHFYIPDMEEDLPEVLTKLATNQYDIIAVDYINLLAQMSKEKWEALDKAGIYAKRYAGKHKTQILFLAQLDKNTGDTRYSKALMEHACIVPETKILTTKGYITLEEIIGYDNILASKNKSKGFYKFSDRYPYIDVISIDNKIKRVNMYYNNGIADVYKVTLSNEMSIICTGNHKFYTPEDAWKKLDNLDINDYIAIDVHHAFPNGYSKIFNIDYLGKRPTFDLSVPDTHCYVANGILSHNSNMWSWNHTLQDIMENQKIDIQQPKARNQNPIPFSLRANLACSKFTDYIEDMDDNYNKKKKYNNNNKSDESRREKVEPLSKGFDAGGSDVPDD